jgi:hypothetical protein
MSGSSKWSRSLRFPHQNSAYTSPLPHMCYMSHSSHSSRSDYLKNIWWGVHSSKLLIMQFSPLHCYLIPLRPKFLLSTYSQTSSAYVPSSMWKKSSVTPIHNNRQNYSSIFG